MDNNSTSKMLAQLQGQKNGHRPEKHKHQENGSVNSLPVSELDSPELKPGSEMEKVLANILGPSFKDQNTPFGS